ncbi:hypothetical protein D8674_013559 [Pyrus ussuriensis x Pyrus communis]|uniref:Reverse transcriptase zinc-binding domain-containing protein n=1 Tax=Pyrus ussuriensis x Pyrus communis TaxID=2448454 RepID=A0A5N5GX24_9ROSA|nr:hypothetical protein D8674_013559 [Pyrus ussuriensis x Pyrus communis]
MGMPKCDGGMGFNNFGDFNLALLAWVLKDRYFLNSSFLEAKRGGRASWIYITVSHLILIGNGVVNLEQTIESIINHEAGAWDLDPICNVILVTDKMAIESSHFGDPNRPDRLVWWTNKMGRYTVKPGYRWILRQRSPRVGPIESINSNVWKLFWGIQAPPKMQNFIWRGVRGTIAISLNLFRRRCPISPTCLICVN